MYGIHPAHHWLLTFLSGTHTVTLPIFANLGKSLDWPAVAKQNLSRYHQCIGMKTEADRRLSVCRNTPPSGLTCISKILDRSDSVPCREYLGPRT
ncbi:hypothetical protein F5B19DRAFT_463517 [Rostrohypoxylon terebratum]|nr:hypothetical protein F5B19DRAFT_463517 [Rostrohypoxylon terebratum]